MANGTKAQELREARKLAFLEDFALHGVVSPAATRAGVHRRTVLTWRKEDVDFAEAYEDAFQCAVDVAELELRRRAVNGVEEPILYKGEIVWRRDPDTGQRLLDDDFNPIPYTVHRASDRLLEVYTRAHRPAYKERSSVELSGPGGSSLRPTTIVVNFVDPPDWDNVRWDPATGRPALPPDPLDD